MKDKLPTDERMNDLLLNESLIPLVKMLLESDELPECEKLKEHLSFFNLISASKIKDNSTYVCFANLKTMYQHDDIPKNIFWISSVNSRFSGTPIPPYLFLEEVRKIIENTKANGFNLTHEMYFAENLNSGVFFHFVKDTTPKDHDFISILIAYQNTDNNPTLLQARDLNK